MTVFVIESAPNDLRGELCRWMLEARPGVFIAKTSRLVRDSLWEKIKNHSSVKGALMIFSASTETGYYIEMTGDPTRSVVDLDGVQLIKINRE